MSTAQVAPPTDISTPKDIQSIVPAIVRRAEEITIETAEDYEEAGHALKWVAGQTKKFLEWFEPHVKRAYDNWKSLTADREARIGPANEARKIIEGKMQTWRVDQEAKRRALETEAREKARLEELARANEEAKSLESSGDVELAQVVREQAAAAPAPVIVVESSVPKVSGISKAKETWKFRIVNEALIPREYMTPNMAAIGGVVRAQKKKCVIPGIEVYCEESVAVRA